VRTGREEKEREKPRRGSKQKQTERRLQLLLFDLTLKIPAAKSQTQQKKIFCYFAAFTRVPSCVSI